MGAVTSSKTKTELKTASNDFTFFWGAASGTDRKVLKTHGEENVIINFATQQNKPWKTSKTFSSIRGDTQGC